MDENHRHDWQPTNTGFACTSCDQTTTPCSDCSRPLETTLTICDPCLNRARKIIRDITEAIDTIPFQHAEIIGLRSPRYDRDRITSSDDPDRLPFGLDAIIEDPEDTRIDAAKYPATALDILRGWAAAWADTRNDPTPNDDLQYLIDHTLWAAQNQDASGWTTYLNEARQVRATIRRLLGINPERENGPCVHCGGTIVREWLPDGLDDTRRCQQCQLTWPDEQRLAYTNRHTVIGLRATHPDMLVTIDEAKAILPEARRGTLDTWARRGLARPESAKFPTHGTNLRGTHLYRLGDVADAWHNRDTKPA